jgi:FKBP-type peptidyl-prolyl cis-trans isomerase
MPSLNQEISVSRTQRIRRFAVVLGCALALGGIAGCSNTPTTPTANVRFSQDDILLGTGTEAVSGKTLTVKYTGWLYDASQADKKGLIFDSSIGGDPFSFTLGAGQVIQGWDRGLVGMRVGGLRRLTIPPSLAYGGTRRYTIPAYSTLIFDIELVDVQ